MNVKIILFLLCSLPALAARPLLVDDVVRQIQKQYDKTSSFSADFTQHYHHKILNRDDESSGHVSFQRPGKLRWDYAKPAEKSFVVDGKSLWIYQKADNLVYVDKCFKQDTLTASVSFLWGGAKIRSQFNVSWFDGVFGQESDLHLTLTPKKKNGLFKRLIVVVDPKTYRVTQSIVVDMEGNTNQFVFVDAQFNAKLPVSIFQFKAPKGTHVEPVPGSCGL